MKNLMLLMLLFSIGFSCSKDPLNVNSNNSKKANFADFDQGLEWAVSCGGSCVPAGSCTHIRVGENSYECPCESCYLEISLVGEQTEGAAISDEDAHSMISDLVAKNGTFKKDLNDHISAVFGALSYKVTRVNLLTQNKYFGLIYTFQLEDGQIESVAFLKSLASEGAEPIKMKVDCSGPCDSPTAKCKERWIPGNPPAAECTCEGECSMTIESLPGTEE